MKEKIEKVIDLLEEIKQERWEAFIDCNGEEIENDDGITCEDVEDIETVIAILENLL